MRSFSIICSLHSFALYLLKTCHVAQDTDTALLNFNVIFHNLFHAYVLVIASDEIQCEV